MTTQPEALRLADALGKHLGGNTAIRCATELRRLHESNQELLAALKAAASVLGLNGCFEAQDRARAAIAKAERITT